MKVFLILCTIVLSFAGSVLAQTDLLNVLWDLNTEADIDRYRLQRAVNGANNFQDLAIVNHPTAQVTDTDVSPGNVYTYRVAAIDQAGNMSIFSEVVSAGLPKIDLSLADLPNHQPTILAKSSFLSDPNDPVDNLNIIIDQQNHASVSVQSGSITISVSPDGYSGAASFRIRAEDNEGFFDLQTVSFTFTEQIVTEITINIPNIVFDEDSSVTLNLDDYVTVTGAAPADLSWSFSGGANLNLVYDPLRRTLAIDSREADWFGQNQIIATATAPDQTAASDAFQATINPVNDTPAADIQQLLVHSDADSNIIDLKPYATDVDNTPAELAWEFSGFNHFSFEWVNQSANIVKIVPAEGAVTESGVFRVSDPAGASDEASVTLIFDGDGGVFEVNIPNIVFDEDSSVMLNLDDYVTVTGVTPADLSWSFSGGANLNLVYDPLKRTLAIGSREADWFGQNQVTAVAAAPDQTSASDAFQVTVNPLNDAPVADIQQLLVYNDPDSNIIDLKPYATDVDNTPAELAWEFSGFNHFSFEWVNQSANIVKIVPAEGAVTESGVFRVSDPAGASDEASVTLIIDNGGGVFEVNIPNVQWDEDQQLSLQMDNFVTISGASQEVGWSFSPGPNLQFAFDAATRTLTIQAKTPHWFGADEMAVIATLPGFNTQTETFSITIRSVNDAPVISVQNLTINPQGANQFDLKTFASDVDHSAAELNWEFSGFTQFAITLIDPAQKIIEIIPLNSAVAGETGIFRATDPSGASDSRSVTLEMIDNLNHTYDVTILNGKEAGEMDVSIAIDVPSRIEFRYWLDAAQIFVENQPDLKTQHNFTLKDLLPDTAYFYSAIIRDGSNRLIAAVDSTFRSGASSTDGRLVAEEIIVYPNPVKTNEGHREMIFTNLPEASKMISLFALNGDRVYQEEFPVANGSEHRINIAENGVKMPSGMYIYMVKDENARVLKTGKVVVVH